MCCATTAKVNDVRERVEYKYEEIEIGISIYMDNISVAGGPEKVKKRKRKCAGMEVEKKVRSNVSKNKHMVVKKGKKGRKYFKTNESRKHSKNQEIQIHLRIFVFLYE